MVCVPVGASQSMDHLLYAHIAIVHASCTHVHTHNISVDITGAVLCIQLHTQDEKSKREIKL